MVIICSDHAGFEYKEKVKDYLKKENIKFEDVGALSFDANDDYPDFAISAVNVVLKDKDNVGIFLCGSGVGVSMVANRYKGIRAVLGYSTKVVELARQHEDSNVLCVGARLTSWHTTKKMILAFLNTKFSSEERHVRRISKY